MSCNLMLLPRVFIMLTVSQDPPTLTGSNCCLTTPLIPGLNVSVLSRRQLGNTTNQIFYVFIVVFTFISFNKLMTLEISENK